MVNAPLEMSLDVQLLIKGGKANIRTIEEVLELRLSSQMIGDETSGGCRPQAPVARNLGRYTGARG